MTELEQIKDALGDAAGDFALILWELESREPLPSKTFALAQQLYARLAKVRTLLADPVLREFARLESMGLA